jgi:hypothetical protein
MGRSSEPDEDVIAMQGRPDQSVLDMIMDAPSNISRGYFWRWRTDSVS